MRILTETQILENLSPCFQPSFTKIRRDKIYSGEPILYAADFSGNNRSRINAWGFMIFTDRRYLKVYAPVSDTIGSISYYQSGSTWDKIIGNEVSDRRWFNTQRMPAEHFSKVMTSPFDIAFSTIKGIIKADYTIVHDSHHIPLLELQLEFHNRAGEIRKTFKAQAVREVRGSVHQGVRNGSGSLPGIVSVLPDV